jgi:hypothetical protein
MKKMLLLGIMAVALLAAGTAHAAHAGLSLSGETGIARTPLAMTLAPMTLGVAADYVFSDDTFVPIRAEFGVIDGLEVGGKYWFMDTEGDPKNWGVNGKYVLPFQMVENLAVAVGANYDVTSSDAPDDLTDIGLYAVATYNAKVGEMAIVPSVGISWDKVKMGDFDESGIRFFGSVAVMVMPNLAIAGELISTNDDLDGDDADMSYWVGARFMPMDGLTVQAGLINNANVGGDASDAVFHVGAQYAFSFGK